MASIELASTIAEITALCLKTTMLLEPLISKFPTASHMIKAIQSECTAIGTSLSQIQSFLLQDTSLRGQPGAGQAFDTVITGCKALFACIEQKVEKLSHKTVSKRQWSPWGARVAVKMTWGGEEMENCLEKLRNQRGAVEVLMELLKMRPSNQEPLKIDSTSEVLQRQTAITKSLHADNPGANVPASLLENIPLRQGIPDRGLKTTYDQEFAFDNLLVNSEAYRRSMGIPPSRVTRECRVRSMPDETETSGINEKRDPVVDTSSPSNTWHQDDELPEYTPYPAEPGSQPLQANYGYVPQTRAIFGFPNAPAPKPTPSDWVPPTWVPGSPNESRALEATPNLIQYTKPLNKETSFPVRIRNPNTTAIQFRVRTSAPRKYCVRPNRGSIGAGATITVQFVLVPREDPFPKEKCVDKFMVESITVKTGERFEWATDGERRKVEIARMKIRVEFVDREGKMEKEG